MIVTRPAPHALPDEFATAIAHVTPRLGAIGREIVWYPEITSTSDIAGSLADNGAEEGLVVIADMQTAGRGRLGRTWSSPPGAGLYASVVLRPRGDIARLLTIASGVAVAEGIARATGLEPELKWPNDLHCAGRKLAGILAERAPGHVVLGFGVNVLQARYPADVAMRATSIEFELGRPVDRGLVFAECLAALTARYRDLDQGRDAAVLTAWRGRAAAMFGRRVEWDAAGASQQGLAERVDDDGALVVRTESGPLRVISGEVRWIS